MVVTPGVGDGARWYNALMKPGRKLYDSINPRLLASEPIRRCKLEDCLGACCIFGVWVDKREVADILKHAALILPHMPEDCREPADWFAGSQDNDPRSPSGVVIHTGVENRPYRYGKMACSFWLDDGKCALQVAAVKNGLHPWRFKPYYCILHPLDLDEEGRITVDETAELLNEPGSCVRQSEEKTPLLVTFESELRYLLGDKRYLELVDELDIDGKIP